MRLVLFDIDGTLLLTDGAGRRALHRALVSVFGHTGPPEHPFGGKTDPQIVRESLMRIAGRSDSEIDVEMRAVLAAYLEFLPEELRASGDSSRVMPGIPDLLDAVEARDDATMGLLTGNLAAGARAKLESVGLDPNRFVIGAYGSDHEDRHELPAIARDRALEQRGIQVRGSEIVIIGDTPSDVSCGRALGARAIAVATGTHALADLDGMWSRVCASRT